MQSQQTAKHPSVWPRSCAVEININLLKSLLRVSRLRIYSLKIIVDRFCRIATNWYRIRTDLLEFSFDILQIVPITIFNGEICCRREKYGLEIIN